MKQFGPLGSKVFTDHDEWSAYAHNAHKIARSAVANGSYQLQIDNGTAVASWFYKTGKGWVAKMKPMKLHTTHLGTEEQRDREAYLEQRAEARAEGINIGTFEQWKERDKVSSARAHIIERMKNEG